MSILVVGGAGYVGSHTVDYLLQQNCDVVVVDNLCLGHRQAVPANVPFYLGDIRDKEWLRLVFQQEKIDGVIHFAAYSLVGESVQKPLEYFNNNIYGTQILLEVMQEFGVDKIVFSSSAATYGEPKSIPILETEPLNPKNPYGDTKRVMESMMRWADDAHGLKSVALRYFNVAGAKEDGSIGEDHNPETHLIPIILQVALGQREHLQIFGDDYDTPDGTCIRDYVHVMDLAQAHYLAMKYLIDGGQTTAFNLGSENGYSVKEVYEAAKNVTGVDIPAVISPRRAGDPSKLVASSKLIQEVLGWKPEYHNVEDIIATAWKWHQKHPHGYED